MLISIASSFICYIIATILVGVLEPSIMTTVGIYFVAGSMTTPLEDFFNRLAGN